MKPTSLKAAIKLALGGAALSVVAFAPAAQAQTSGESETQSLDVVTVLGSRIKRTEIETALPVFTIERADLERSGLTQIGDVLKEMATNGISISLNTNNGNTSGNTGVNLRNCGSVRTLVLVNGRRWISSNALSGSVDLSSIPFAAVERIEVLKDGASALYGTDAICGVINITTRTNYSGAEARAYVGQYDQDDGYRQAYDFTIGTANERGSVLFNVAYTKQEEVSAADRPISAVPLYGFPANTGSPGRASITNPYGWFNIPGRGAVTLDHDSPGCRPNQVCAPSVATSDFRAYNFAEDAYNFAVDNYLIQPQETRSLYVQGSYSIFDNLTFRSEAFYTKREGEAQLAAMPLSPLSISADNIYNPFGVNITGGQFRPILYPRVFGQSQDTWRYSGALEGNFDIGSRSFYWDVGFGYAENTQVQIKNGFFFTTRIQQALGPSYIDAGGVARCGTPAATISGCVPFNVFGGPNGVTQDMINYVQVAPRNVQNSNMYNYTANISSELVDLPAGALALAAGYEYRREAGYDSPDPLTAANLVLNDNPYLPTRGGYNVNEFYAELSIPLLKDIPVFKHLEVSLAARYSDYNTFGETTNPKFGLRWQVFDDLLIRGSYGEGFRAPSISELYSGQGSGFPAASDPCSINSVPYQSNAEVRARCAAAGIPTNYVQANSQVRASSGGNPLLAPETAKNKTLGFVYSPSFLPGADFSIDWYNIRIANAIGSRSAQGILNDCFVTGIASRCGQIQRDLTGAVFANPGEITDVIALNQNFAGGTEVEGFDFSANYKFSTSFGDFRINWDNAYITYLGDLGQPARGELNADGDISAGNVIGRNGAGASGGGTRFRLRSTLGTTWTYGAWTVSGIAEYMSGQQESCNNVRNTALALDAIGLGDPSYITYCSDPDRIINIYNFQPGTTNVVATPGRSPVNRMGSMTYFDLVTSWNAPWDGRVTLGIRNLFDRDPPYCGDCFANSFDPQYRIPGRFYYASYQQRF